MREILDGGVAVLAAENSVDARGMFLRTDGNIGAFFRFHVRLAVAGEAGFILFQRLRRFFLIAGEDGKAKYEKKQKASGKGGPSRTIRMFHASSQHDQGSS